MVAVMMRVCPGCKREIPSRMYACPPCWRRIPGNLRTAILRAWGRRLRHVPGAKSEHDDACAAAQAWLDGNPR